MLKTFELKIVYLFTILTFTNIIVYQYVMHITPIQSNIFFVGLAMLVFVYRLLYTEISSNSLLGRMGAWSLIYFFITTSYFILSNPGKIEFTYYKEILNSIIIILAYYWILSEKKSHIKVARVAMLHATIITVVLLIIDFFIPGTILDRSSDFFIAGRSSGLTLNPNTAGTVLILGLILSLDMVYKRLRLLYMLIVFMGVLVTFSRSAILLYLILTLIFAIQKKINFVSLLISIISLSFVFGMVLAFALHFLKSNGIKTSNIEQRIAYIESFGGSGIACRSNSAGDPEQYKCEYFLTNQSGCGIGLRVTLSISPLLTHLFTKRFPDLISTIFVTVLFVVRPGSHSCCVILKLASDKK